MSSWPKDLVYWCSIDLWSIGVGGTSGIYICAFFYMWNLFSVVVLHRSMVNWRGEHLISVCTSSENMSVVVFHTSIVNWRRREHLISVCTSSENMSSIWNLPLLHRGLFNERPIIQLVCLPWVYVHSSLCETYLV